MSISLTNTSSAQKTVKELYMKNTDHCTNKHPGGKVSHGYYQHHLRHRTKIWHIDNIQNIHP